MPLSIHLILAHSCLHSALSFSKGLFSCTYSIFSSLVYPLHHLIHSPGDQTASVCSILPTYIYICFSAKCKDFKEHMTCTLQVNDYIDRQDIFSSNFSLMGPHRSTHVLCPTQLNTFMSQPLHSSRTLLWVM